MIACVLIEIKSKKIDKTFDYLIPESLIPTLKVGMRVLVPFGMQKLEGYILEIKKEPSGEYELKEIIEQLDEEVILNDELLQIGTVLKQLTLSSLSSAYATMLPSALKAKKRKTVSKKYETFLHLLMPYEKAIAGCKNKVQRDIISLFDGVITVRKKDANQISSSAVTTLIKHQILKENQEESYRFHIGLLEQEPKKVLNEEQQSALQKILKYQEQPKTILLHGVTGSGKTEIYMQAIEEVIKKGKQALVLVPEISLTPQFIHNFAKRFGDKIAVLHSGLSQGEKYDEWRKIMRREVNIVIGARSAIFAPLKEIGIIVVDECHSDSYKQENSPKYHVLSIANIRSTYHKCPIILGSATPTLEIMARAKKGLFELIELKTRAHHNALPKCTLVNMKEEVKHKHPIISRLLEEKIEDRLRKKEQIMILLNRRGHSTIIQCSSCGFCYKCPHCDITLTYHKTSKNLRCHYCGYTKYIDCLCPNCKENSLNYYGLGTEKLELLLKERFQTANIIRMDTDTTSRKGSLEKIIDGFKKREYDILIGTQMISKGLDFPNVTLVGIVNTDNSFNIPDFRSGEKNFALLHQASGRAGRANIPGEVIIETFNPDNKILECVRKQDFELFYTYEMNIRKTLKYPPYYYLSHLVIKSKDCELAKVEANKAADYLKRKLSNHAIILGPSIANMFRINNVYHFEIMIKYRQEENLMQTLKELDQLFLINQKVDLDIDVNY